jgi:hypothetical protein
LCCSTNRPSPERATGLQERVLADGRLEVVANVKNRENRRIEVQINCVFKDDQGFYGDETPFQTLILAEYATEAVRFTAANTAGTLHRARPAGALIISITMNALRLLRFSAPLFVLPAFAVCSEDVVSPPRRSLRPCPARSSRRFPLEPSSLTDRWRKPWCRAPQRNACLPPTGSRSPRHRRRGLSST